MSSMRDIVLSLCCVLFLAILIDGGGFDPYCKITLCQPKGRSGEPLFLTPYILSGQWKQGQKIAQVPPLLDDINSYSGYLTVNQQYKSNMFFWYFPAENNSSEAPVALWLQGGPGSSSMFSLFLETGPFIINADLSLRRRPNSWTQNINMLYIDNPVGTGFSFTKDDRGYATNEEDVGRDLYAALVQFFLLFPDLQDNEFFLTGESYAGKYIPALARSIHMNNPSGVVKINLQGMAIGNGFIDPENMMKYGDYLFQHGLVDRFGLAVYHNIEDKIRDDIKNERFAEAGRAFGSIFMISAKLLGDVDVYNYLLDTETQLSGARIVQLFCQPQVRKRIHVGNLTYNDGKVVQKYLEVDMAKSVKPWFQELIEYYRVLLYNGQLDIIVAYPLTVNFIENLEWSGAEEYKLTHRKEWYVRNNLAGYSKTVKNFTELMIRDAGHMVPSDQPEYALDMIERFVKNQPF